MSFNPIRENKILAKISGFTVVIQMFIFSIETTSSYSMYIPVTSVDVPCGKEERFSIQSYNADILHILLLQEY